LCELKKAELKPHWACLRKIRVEIDSSYACETLNRLERKQDPMDVYEKKGN